MAPEDITGPRAWFVADAQEYAQAHTHAACCDRLARGRVRVSGADRAAFLQGLLTNDVAALASGTGCYAAYLTPQGRMIADMRVLELGDAILLDVTHEVAAPLAARLATLIFTEDVAVADVSGARAQMGVYGPEAARAVAAAFAARHARDAPGPSADRLDGMREHDNARWDFDGAPALVARNDEAGVPGFDLYIDRSLGAALTAAVVVAGAPAIAPETLHVLRIEQGRPLFGIDMDETTIPLEAGLEQRAISLTKGCYVGQEVIIRVLHRGHGRVARRLVGVLSTLGVEHLAGASLVHEGREVGRVTSAARSPRRSETLGLGYVARDVAGKGAALEAVSGDARAPATIVSLPVA